MISSCRQHSINKAALFLCAFTLLLTSCARTLPKPNAAAYAKEIEQWRAERIAELKSETGWLALIGLFSLKPGENKFGSDPKNDIVLPKDKVGAFVGTLTLEHGAVRLSAQPNSGITVDDKPVISLDLQSDEHGKPTVMNLGSLSLTIIKRGDKMGLRVRDKDNPDRAKFQGTQWFPTDLKWRIDAKFELYNPPKPMPIMNVLGMETAESSPGAIVFAFNGQTYRLDALTEEGEKRFFMIIADQTSGKETYPAGRYLYVDPPDSSGRGGIVFNKAYSPPCAFTKSATCPLL